MKSSPSPKLTAVLFLALLAVSSCFAPTQLRYLAVPTTTTTKQSSALFTASDESSPQSTSSSTSSSSTSENKNVIGDDWFSQWAADSGIVINSKLTLRDPTADERGKGGVEATEAISALEVLATIPRDLIVSAVDAPTRAMEAAASAQNFSWATDLTAAALVSLHPIDGDSTSDAITAKQAWIQTWQAGGWATDSADLGPPEANFGAKDVTGSLLATGSDNDHNIFAKFRMPCHPVIFRSSVGLGVLTGCTEDEAREALYCRGRMFRSMRDALEGLVVNASERAKGSKREKRVWDVADTMSRVMSRATMLELDDSETDDADNQHPVPVIVPLHERLAHCGEGHCENSKLVASGDNILLLATREIAAGDAITRDYTVAPRLDQDESQGSLHLLLQFGLPPTTTSGTAIE